MRILCLHGSGTNSKIFETQTAALRRILNKHKFEFVDGSLPCSPSPEIAELVEEGTDCCQWYDYTLAKSIADAVRDLSEFAAAEGPFDGVMGFSQGDALAAMALAQLDFPTPFSFAIFIYSGIPFSKDALSSGNVRACGPDTAIHVPTAHIIGAKDWGLEYATGVIKFCSEDLREVFDHGGGHEIPTKPKGVVEEMASTIRKVIAMASFVS